MVGKYYASFVLRALVLQSGRKGSAKEIQSQCKLNIQTNAMQTQSKQKQTKRTLKERKAQGNQQTHTVRCTNVAHLLCNRFPIATKSNQNRCAINKTETHRERFANAARPQRERTRNHCAITRNHCAITAKSLRNQCTINAQSLYNHSTITAQSLCNHCVITAQSLCNHSAVAAQSWCNRYPIAALSLCSCCAITAQSLQSLRRRCAIAS
jgi:hypothetical protein